MTQLTENVRVHFPFGFQDEGIIAANSLNERTTVVLSLINEKIVRRSYVYFTNMTKW